MKEPILGLSKEHSPLLEERLVSASDCGSIIKDKTHLFHESDCRYAWPSPLQMTFTLANDLYPMLRYKLLTLLLYKSSWRTFDYWPILWRLPSLSLSRSFFKNSPLDWVNVVTDIFFVLKRIVVKLCWKIIVCLPAWYDWAFIVRTQALDSACYGKERQS